MGNKTINVTLSVKGMSDALKEYKRWQKDIEHKLERFRRKVAEKLVSEAKKGFGNAIVDDFVYMAAKKANVNVYYRDEGNMMVVIADGEDAIWAEFGAGVHHNGSAGSSPNPLNQENNLGFTIGSYGYGLGKMDSWYFKKDPTDPNSSRVYTYGAPASMPMYKAVTRVRQEIATIAREVFK